MTLEVTCEKCGRLLSLSNEQTGQRTQCPHCNNDIYVPTPEEDIQELPLAPEDSEEVNREEQLQAERRHIDRILAKEDSEKGGKTSRQGSTQTPKSSGRRQASVKDVVMDYLLSMAKGDLDRAEKDVELLNSHREEALRIVDELIADQIPPDKLSDVPPAVYQGFLKTLRSRF